MALFSADKAHIFRITHIDNVQWALENGLQCRNSPKLDPNFRNIGHPEVIDKRASCIVRVEPGGTLSDYIPFYFTPYSPMLLNIKTGFNGLTRVPLSEIVILVSSLHHLAKQRVPFVFTDRHALLATAQFSNNLDDLVRIDWDLLCARDFKRDPVDDPGKVERYQAEALVHREVPISALLGMFCYDPKRADQISGQMSNAQVSLKVKSGPEWYV
jgi:hypothetical protein